MKKQTPSTSSSKPSQRGALILILACILGVLVIWLSRDRQPVPETQRGSNPAEASATPRPAAADASVPGTPSADQTANQTRLPAATDGPAATDPDQMLCVVVKDAATHKPVANVAVHYLRRRISWQQLDDQERLAVSAGDWLDRCRDLGATQTTNAAGCVWIERSSYLGAAAEDRTRYGKLELDQQRLEEPGPYALLLHQATRPAVKIVNQAGEVLPYFPLLLRPTRAGEVIDDAIPRLRTAAADGIWRIRDLDHFLRDSWREPEDGAYEGVEVRVAIPVSAAMQASASATILFAAPPKEPVVLVAPDTGSVILRAEDPLGRPVGRYGDFALTDQETGQRYVGSAPLPGGNGMKFLYVPLGRTLVGESFFEAGNAEAEDRVFTGPQYVGHTVEATLSLKIDGVTVVGKLVDADGDPIRSASFRLQIAAADERRSPHATTQEDGYFLVELDEELKDKPLDLAYIQMIKGAFTQQEEPLGSGVALGMRSFQQGLNDAGTLQVVPMPAIASGRILIDGSPGPAEVYAEWLPPAGGPDNWDQIRGTAVTTTADGDFTLRGIAPRARAYRLYAYVPDAILPQQHVAFAIGQKNLEATVTRGGSLTAEVRFDPAITPDALICRLQPVSGDRAATTALNYMWRTPWGRDASKEEREGHLARRWQGLVPGNYRLDVLADGCAQPLATVLDLAVAAASETKDPRLCPIDLRGRVTAIPIEIECALPTPVFVNATGTADFAAQMDDGVVTVFGTPPMDLTVRAKGCYPEWLRNVQGACSVTLKALPEVPIAVAAVEIPAGWRGWLSASASTHDTDAKLMRRWGAESLRERLSSREAVELGEAQTLTIRARQGDRVSLQAYLERADDESDRRELALGTNASFVASPTDKATVRIPAADVRAATGQ